MKPLMAVTPQRDADGYWTHPDLPEFEEGDFDDWNYWKSKQGLMFSTVFLEDHDDHPACRRYFEEGDSNISDWHPEPPDSSADWFLVCISDTDDGPAAWFAKRVYEQAGNA